MYKLVVVIFFLFIIPYQLFSEYPEIKALNRTDILYFQLIKDVESYYKASMNNKPESRPALLFFIYRKQKGETIFTIAARCNIPYDSLCTLNRAANITEFDSLNTIIIPNLPGIFVPLKPSSALEEIMVSWRQRVSKDKRKIKVKRKGKIEEYFFYLGDRFHSIERAYFLKILFQFPLANFKKTSDYGIRPDPFTGHPSFHNGIDLAAPVGTPVYAAKEGTVVYAGTNDIYGHYIIIAHPGNYQTVYGHLSKIMVTLNDKVTLGTIIGKTGISGRTTGPHLHFEIRRKGEALNPSPLLP